MNETEVNGYEIGREFVKMVGMDPVGALNGFNEAMAEIMERTTAEEFKAAVKKAEERGAMLERERFVSALSDIVPNLQLMDDESRSRLVNGKVLRPQVRSIMERINFSRHILNAKGAEFDGSTMEAIERVPSTIDRANTVCEAFSDAYITIFDGIVV